MSTTLTRRRSSAFRELWGSRSLINNLAQRDLRSRYKRSLLGWLWSLINPASTLLIYSIVFGVVLRVTPPPAHNPEVKSFALYLFAGLVVWNLFAGVLTAAIASLEGMGSLMTKVYFPPAAPAIATMATSFTQTLIESGVLLGVTLALANQSWWMLLLPLALIPVAFCALGIGLALSAYNVLYRDVGYLVTVALNMLFYATPIVYPITAVPVSLHGFPLRRVFELNPTTQFVQVARDLVYFGRAPLVRSIAYSIAVAVASFTVGWVVFQRKAREVVEEL
jgi:ABC-type polysaccharide/polyol phosphate export permease